MRISSENLLLTPGPTPVPGFVAAAEAMPIAHHRSPEFRPVLGRVLAALARIYRTQGDVILVTGSATQAMESAFANLLSPRSRILVVSAGSFGERWVAMGEAWSAQVDVDRYPWGARPDPARVAERVRSDPGLDAAFIVHSETSTGAVADIAAVAAGCRERSCCLVVDAVSSLGAAPLETDAWGLDVVVAGAQKALMSPPGLSFVSVSERALAQAATATNPRFALDWQRAVTAQTAGTTPFTPAISLVNALDAALQRIERDTLEVRIAQTRVMGTALRAAMHALGLVLYSPDHPDCSLVTAVRWPEGIDGEAVRRRIRDRHGVTLAGGQGEATGRIFRIGAFGAIEPRHLVCGLAGLEVELADAGYPVRLGNGVGAFLTALDAAAP